MIALDLQLAILERATGAALLFELLEQRFERGGVVAQAADHSHGLATSALAVAPDSRGLAGGRWIGLALCRRFDIGPRVGVGRICQAGARFLRHSLAPLSDSGLLG